MKNRKKRYKKRIRDTFISNKYSIKYNKETYRKLKNK